MWLLKFKIFYSISFEYFFLNFFIATYFCHYNFFFFSHLLSHLSQILSWNLTNYLLFVVLIMIFPFSRENSSSENRSSNPEVFFIKGVLKICSKFTAEHQCPSVVSITLLCNFIEIRLRHGCSPMNLLRIYRTPFLGTPLGGCFC